MKMEGEVPDAFENQTSFDDHNYPLSVENKVLEHYENCGVGDTDPSPSNEETIARGPKTEEEMRECKYCEFKAQDWPAFASHVFKPHHIKKVAEAYKIKDTSSSFTCHMCSVTCRGHQSFNAHMLGAKHRKALQQTAAENERNAGGGRMKNSQFGSIQNKKPYDKPQKSAKSIGARVFASYPQPLIGLEYVTEVQVTGQSPRYECSLCDAKFEHDVKFPHLVGQKHRMNVLKIKRPDFVKELHPTSKKRSELTAALLKESIDLELAEGRKEVKFRVEKPPSGLQSSRGHGATRRGAVGKRGRKINIGSSLMDFCSGSGPSLSQGGGTNIGSYESPPSGPPSFSSYGSYGGDRYALPLDPSGYKMAFYSSYDGQNYGSYQQSSDFEQGYPERQPSFSGSRYSGPPQIETPKDFDVSLKNSISSGLANALGDLSKLVKNDDDASVALQVSNALTQALLKYRMDDIKQSLK